MASNPQQLLKRVQRLERREKLHGLFEAIDNRKLSNAEKQRLLGRIAQEALAGNITASEANKLSKAVTSN